MNEPDLQNVICLITDRLNITGAKLAEWLDVEPSVISRIKTGAKKNFGKYSEFRGGRTITPDSFYADVFADEITNVLNYSREDILQTMIVPYIKDCGCLTPALENCINAGYEKFVRNMLLIAFQDNSRQRSTEQINVSIPVESDQNPVVLATDYPRLSMNFFGRNQVIEKIRQMLMELNIVVLQGIGGMGKSCIALKYAEEYSNDYLHIQHVYFKKSIKQTILGLQFENFVGKDQTDEVKFGKYMQFLHSFDEQTLLIIDNMNVEQNDSPDFSELIKCKCHVILTTRIKGIGGPKFILPVEKLPHDEQILLFEDNYEYPWTSITESEKAAIQKIFEQVEGHTLLIELIAKTMNNSDMPASAMLDYLKGHADDSISEISIIKDDVSTQETMDQYVSRIFDISSLDDSEKQILMLLSLAPLSGIRRKIFRTLSTQANNNILNTLENKSWLLTDKGDTPDQKKIRLHPVICQVVQEKTKPDFQKCGDFLRNLLHVMTEISVGNLSDDVIDLAHNVGYCIEFNTVDQIALLRDFAKIVWDKCKYSLALDMYGIALKQYEQNGLQDVDLLIDLHRSTAALYTRLANYHNSISHYLNAIEILVRESRDKDTAAAELYNGIAFVYRKASDYPNALKYFEKSKDIMESDPASDEQVLATVYNDMGVLYVNLAQYEPAMMYYRRALEIREKSPDVKPLNLAYTYHNIGTIYQRQGNYSKAKEFHRKALDIRKKLLDEKHPDIASSLMQIGNDYLESCEYAEAWNYFTTALDIRREKLGNSHPDIAWTLTSMGRWFYNQNQYENALKDFEESLDIRNEKLGPDHAYTAESHYWLGLTYSMLKEYEPAIRHLKQAEKVQDKKSLTCELEKTRMALTNAENKLGVGQLC